MSNNRRKGVNATVLEPARRGAATQSRLRTAAIEAFAENGFHATKVSDIVAKAGVTQPTFYSYFESKDAAYEMLVTRFREELRRITAENLIDPQTPRAELVGRVTLSFQRFLDFLMADRQLTEIGFFQPPGCSVTKALMVEWVGNNIKEEQRTGVFRNDIPANHIARLLVGLLEQMARPGAGGDAQALAAVCAALFCEGAQPARGA